MDIFERLDGFGHQQRGDHRHIELKSFHRFLQRFVEGGDLMTKPVLSVLLGLFNAKLTDLAQFDKCRGHDFGPIFVKKQLKVKTVLVWKYLGVRGHVSHRCFLACLLALGVA